MRYFIIAGEASGDLHAASLIEKIREEDDAAQFAFLGGDLMMRATGGTRPEIHYRDMAFMGFFEVAKNAGKIIGNFKKAKRAIDEFSPECIILIDYPSFNLKMASYAKKKGIKVAYYISPKVWAWKQWRVKKIKKLVDLMLVIFPFEVEFYAKYGMDVKYVGNPSVEEVDAKKSVAPTFEDFRKTNHLQDKPIVALLPGSRMAEIRTNLPMMAEAIKSFPQYRGVVAGAPGIDADFYNKYTNLPVVYDQTFDLLANAKAAVVTSGTATLETALMDVPQVAVYRNCGSKLVYSIMKNILKVKYVTLPNIIANRQIIPELLLHYCTPDTIFKNLAEIIPDKEPRRKQLEGYADLRSILGNGNASSSAAKLIVAMARNIDNQDGE